MLASGGWDTREIVMRKVTLVVRSVLEHLMSEIMYYKQLVNQGVIIKILKVVHT